MKPQEIIAKKRDGESLSGAEISEFIKGAADGSWADYQISALVMAMFINELNVEEQFAITKAMLESGEVLDFSEFDAPVADKHSTGGVGDKTSLLIAPTAAACGVIVPMISGRGLGHTGGTLDKLESIAGYNVNLSTEELKKIIKKCGFALTGQTAEIAPADKKLYALRDATATIETVPLIVASIMSKKLAEGLDALVLDVKTGSGAFMQKFDDSKRLAEALVETGNRCGVKTVAAISDMNQPLGKFIGNSLEVYECIKILRGEIEKEMLPTLELSIELAAQMLVLCKIESSIENAKLKIQKVLDSGDALEKFRRNIELQNGDIKVCDKPESLIDKDLLKIEIKPKNVGFIGEIDAAKIGKAISEIGGGRTKAEDSIDHQVGYACEKKIGDEIKSGENLGVLYCRNEKQADLISEKLRNAYKINDNKPQKSDLIKEIV